MPRGRNPYPGASSYTDRHGKLRWRYRVKGRKAVPLPSGGPGSPNFRDAYEAAVAGAAVQQIGASRSQPGTFSALIAEYYGSSNFKKLDASTQRGTRQILERFRLEHGHRRVAHLKREHVLRLMDQRAEHPAAANNLLKRLRWLMTFAVDRNLAS